MDSVGEAEGGKIWENGIETCKISCMKRVASPGSMHDRFSSVELLSHVRLFETPWTEARQASLSITNSQSLLKSGLKK